MDCTATPPPSTVPGDPKAPLEDWSALIAELVGYGLSQQEIAAHCHCGQPAISDLARGETKDPRHRVGERLRALRTTKRSEAAKKTVAAALPSGGAAGGLAIAAGG